MTIKSAERILKNKKLPEHTKEDIENKIRITQKLYGEPAENELCRLKEKIEYFREIEECQSDYAKFQKHISAGKNFSAYIKQNGSVFAIGQNEEGSLNVKHFKDIIAIASNSCLTIGLCRDGKVLTSGNMSHKALVKEWRDITDISMGYMHCIGLKADGTVCAAKVSGFNDSCDQGQLSVDSWENIVSVTCGPYYSVGVMSNGKVVFTGAFGDFSAGFFEKPSEEFMNSISEWKDIRAVAAGRNHILGLKKDGTVLALGSNDKHQCDVASWEGVVAIAAGYAHSVGLSFTGNLLIAGKEKNSYQAAREWDDIVAIASTYEHIVAMTDEATLRIIENNGCRSVDGAVVRIHN